MPVSRRSLLISAAAVATTSIHRVVHAGSASAQTASGAPNYELIEVARFDSPQGGWFADLADSGLVGGNTIEDDTSVPTLWRPDGTAESLDTDGATADLSAIDNNGNAVGLTPPDEPADFPVPVIWIDGTMRRCPSSEQLAPVTGGTGLVTPAFISDSGVVSGQTLASLLRWTCTPDSEPIDVIALPGQSAEIHASNSRGDVAGISMGSAGQEVFLWTTTSFASYPIPVSTPVDQISSIFVRVVDLSDEGAISVAATVSLAAPSPSSPAEFVFATISTSGTEVLFEAELDDVFVPVRGTPTGLVAGYISPAAGSARATEPHLLADGQMVPLTSVVGGLDAYSELTLIDVNDRGQILLQSGGIVANVVGLLLTPMQST